MLGLLVTMIVFVIAALTTGNLGPIGHMIAVGFLVVLLIGSVTLIYAICRAVAGRPRDMPKVHTSD
jgi:hypothetical protein